MLNIRYFKNKDSNWLDFALKSSNELRRLAK